MLNNFLLLFSTFDLDALSMLSGFIWATSNINTVAIVKTIGLSIGNLIWGAVSLILSWVISKLFCKNFYLSIVFPIFYRPLLGNY